METSSCRLDGLRRLPDYWVGVARVLQYGVREGREAGEVVVIPKAFYCKSR